jgi:tRNA pseudouridine38-40 synthase
MGRPEHAFSPLAIIRAARHQTVSSHTPESFPASASPAAEAAPLRRVALRVAYDGSAFHGWQVQDHCGSVEEALERAVSTAVRIPVRVYGSGRTDAGVHALDQVAHCDIPAAADLDRLRASLNALAGPAISVKDIRPVSSRFHARHSATGKVYRYHIHNRPFPAVFARDRCWWIREPLNLAAMRGSAQALIGTHDFSAFRSSQCASPSAVRTLSRIELAEGEWTDGTLRIELEADGFLQHMARIIVGTLVASGLGKLSPRDVPGILAGRDRARAAVTAPGKGLHLVRVHYDLHAFPELTPWYEAQSG